MVWHTKKKVTKNLKIKSIFDFLHIFSSFPLNCKLVFYHLNKVFLNHGLVFKDLLV